MGKLLKLVPLDPICLTAVCCRLHWLWRPLTKGATALCKLVPVGAHSLSAVCDFLWWLHSRSNSRNNVSTSLPTNVSTSLPTNVPTKHWHHSREYVLLRWMWGKWMDWLEHKGRLLSYGMSLLLWPHD